jgi:hypothetical protein
LFYQVKPGNDVQLADDEQLEGQDHFPVPLGDDDTTVSAEMTLPLLEKTLTLHPFRN